MKASSDTNFSNKKSFSLAAQLSRRIHQNQSQSIRIKKWLCFTEIQQPCEEGTVQCSQPLMITGRYQLPGGCCSLHCLLHQPPTVRTYGAWLKYLKAPTHETKKNSAVFKLGVYAVH